MNGAEAAVKCLEAEGVEIVYGYPGVAICPFFDSIFDTKIRTILVRQEQNAAHEASGYARISGKVGVAAVTSGPGAENLITGIAYHGAGRFLADGIGCLPGGGYFRRC